MAGKKTMLFVHLTPADGLEPYIGAWAHLLAVSNDLVDTIHDHPFHRRRRPGDAIQSSFFPREATYRVWMQFQRKGRSEYGGVYHSGYSTAVKEMV